MIRLHPVVCLPRLIVYLIVLALCILPAVFLNTLFGYVPLLFSLIFPFLSLGYTGRMAARVQCTGISEASECVRGKSVPMQLTIVNQSRFPVVSCRAIFYTTDLDGGIRTSEDLLLSLASHEHRTFAFDVLFDHLGRYDVGLQALRIDGLLGILSFERTEGSSRTIRVLPKIHRMDAFTISELVQNESPHASHTSSAESIDFASVREYAFGDPIKLIHWKLSSHTGTYVTKQMEAYGNHGLTILADNSVPGYSAESRMNVYDALIECTAALGRQARDNGMDVELLHRDRTGAVSRQPLDCGGSFAELLDELPSLEISREATRLSEVLRLEAAGRQTNSNIAVCTAVLDDDAGDAIQNLALSGKIPVVFYLRPFAEAQTGEHGLRVLKTLRSRGISCCLIESADEIGKGGNGMSFRQYIRMILPEAVLGTAASAALSFCILDGFVWSPSRTESPVPVVLTCLVITLLGLLLSWNRRSMAAGAVLAGVAAAGSAVLLYAGGAGEGPMFFVIIVLTALAFFLATRTRIGAALAFAAGILVICGSAFLQFGHRPGCLIVYLSGSACLLVIRLYRIGMLKAATVRPQILRTGVLALTLCLISAASASGLYFLVVQPLDLPTQQLKLVTELRKLPLLEKMGVASTIHLMSREEESGVSDEQKMTSGTPQETEDPDPAESRDTERDTQKNASGTEKENGDGVRYHLRNYSWLFGAAAVIAAMIAAVLLKRCRRKRRRDRLLERTRVQQVVEMYGYFLTMMQRCGMPPVGGDTPLEYSRRIRRRGERFFPKRGEFVRAAQIFERACYGEVEPSGQEYEFYWNTYLDFPKRCMKNGNLVQRIRIFFLS